VWVRECAEAWVPVRIRRPHASRRRQLRRARRPERRPASRRTDTGPPGRNRDTAGRAAALCWRGRPLWKQTHDRRAGQSRKQTHDRRPEVPERPPDGSGAASQMDLSVRATWKLVTERAGSSRIGSSTGGSRLNSKPAPKARVSGHRHGSGGSCGDSTQRTAPKRCPRGRSPFRRCGGHDSFVQVTHKWATPDPRNTCLLSEVDTRHVTGYTSGVR
jgi:hypothetical protein